MDLFTLLMTGALAGWVAGTLVRGAGYGLVVNIVIGVIGGILGARIFRLLGIAAEGWLMEFAMAVLGAIVLLGLVMLLRRLR